jgi:hypothetical protein
MRINQASEAILAKYIQEPRTKKVSPFASHKPKAKGSSLEEFYKEVNARSALQIEQVYSGKNASEIESMMNQNRRLIEAQRKPKR